MRGTNSAEQLNYLVPLLFLYSRNLNDSNSSSFIALQWVPIHSPVLFSIFWNFFKLKRGDLISWWEPILQNGWIIWFPLLYFNSRNFKDSNSSSFIAFQWIPIDSPVLFWIFWNFLKLKRGELISWCQPILQNGWILWSSFLYFNFRNIKDPNSSSFIVFKWVLHDSPIVFSIFWYFLKLKSGN